MRSKQPKNNILATTILKDVVANSSVTDPFHRDFNIETLLYSFHTKLGECFPNYTILDGNEMLTQAFVSLSKINDVFIELDDEIKAIIRTLNCSKTSLIEEILKIINLHHFIIRSHAKAGYSDHSINEINYLAQKKIQDSDGNSRSIDEITDLPVDTFQELLRYVYNSDTINTKNQNFVNDLEGYIIKLIGKTANLANLKQAFEFYKHEHAELLIEEQIIKIKNTPEEYFLLRMAGIKRAENLILATLFAATNTAREISQLRPYSIKNNILYFNAEHVANDQHLEVAIKSVMSTFYVHLKNYRFKKLDSITTQELFMFLLVLRNVLSMVDEEVFMIEPIKKDQIPIKIERKSLIRFLKLNTSLSGNTIAKILSYLTQPFHDDKSIWEKPLIGFGEYYYILFCPLENGHTSFQIDSILKSILSKLKHAQLFRDYVINDLIDIKNNYKFLNITEDVSSFTQTKNLIVYEMRSTLVIIGVAIHYYPISSNDYEEVFFSLEEITSSIKLAKQDLKNHLKVTKSKIKNIIEIILTNHTTLSGLTINDCHLFDYNLLKNYVSYGELKRQTINIDTFGKNFETLSVYRYFKNEREFNSNFKQFFVDLWPIRETYKKFKKSEYPVHSIEDCPVIVREGVESMTMKENISDKINDFDLHLKQLYYFEKDLKTKLKKDAQKKIDFLSPIVLNYVALAIDDNIARYTILESFKNGGLTGTSQLIRQFNQLLSNLSLKPIREEEKKSNSNYDFNSAELLLNDLLKSNDLRDYSPSKTKLNHSFTKEEFQSIVLLLIDQLSAFQLSYYSKKELIEKYFHITIFLCLLAEIEDFNKEIDVVIVNFVDLLNYNHNYQKARNFCEQISKYCTIYGKNSLTPWTYFFRCFAKQNNIMEASFYGCLMISYYNTKALIFNYQYFNIFYGSMLFFRNFGFHQKSGYIYKMLSKLDLSHYNQQKITLSHFSGKLLRLGDRANSFVHNVSKYLVQNKKDIESHGKNTLLPWIVLLYNLRKFTAHHKISSFTQIDSLIGHFESLVDNETINKLKASFFSVDGTTKKIFKDSLINVLETTHYGNLAGELSLLKNMANNALICSITIDNLDINTILLAGLVKNDNSLSFKLGMLLYENPLNGKSKHINLQTLDQYSEHLISNIPIQDGQIVCWLFSVYDTVYALIIDCNKNSHLIEQKWDLRAMNNWLIEISNFNFNDGDYPVNAQEDDYELALIKLAFIDLKIDFDFQELLLSTDIQLASFPLNLIQTDVISKQYEISRHEDKIQDHINTNKLDFLSFHKPITNIISLEWYSNNGMKIIHRKEDLTIEGWIPIVDQDPSINIAHNKLRPVIEKYDGRVDDNIFPSEPPKSKVNVFLAHGEKETNGFKTIYTRHREGSAIIKESGLQGLFGRGEIAILFICNSGFSSKQIYSQKLNSFSQDILKLGYKCVVAPGWNLNPDISGVWLDAFMKELKSGIHVGTAVQRSNKLISKSGYKDSIDQGFYAPTGWAIMHTYGNPNIVFV